MLLGKCKKGFTLAEILIVLTVTGIISILTIPAVIQDIQNQQFKTSWKNVYADLSQTTKTLATQNGGSLKYAFDSTGKTDLKASENFKNAFASKMNVIKNCSGISFVGGNGDGAGYEGCSLDSDQNYYYLYGGIEDTGGAQLPGLILNNGVSILFAIDKSNCSRAVGNYFACGWMAVDTNGFKKPNMWGKDVFYVYLTENNLIPDGVLGNNDFSVSCIEGSTLNTNTGFGCSAKYLMQ